MAQTKKKRSRKHRGTPAGTVDRPARTGQSKSKGNGKGQAKGKGATNQKQAARDRRAERMNREPTWKGSINRAAIAAAVFGVLVILVFQRPIQAGVTLAAFMFVLYIPLGYLTDRAVFNFRKRKRG